jgi:hypothetical protein
VDVLTLLRQARDAGLTLKPEGEKLQVKGPKAAEPVVMLIRDHKPEVMRALFFRRRYRESLEFQRQMGRQRAPDIATPELERTAHAMAWNVVAAEWHRQHGERVAGSICAGCRRPLAGADVLLLPHGEHAHADPEYGCITAYGQQWKGAAASALTQYGIRAPLARAPPRGEFMSLVLCNAQSELTPLERGMHALTYSERNCMLGDSLSAYAKKLEVPQHGERHAAICRAAL